MIASLTIGAGELVFSSRGGALFGYRLLWYFGLVLLAKWCLVYGVARQMVLTGEHPIQSWSRLPGPRGWLGASFALLALISFPIWIAFHAGTTGGLLAALLPIPSLTFQAASYIWGLLLLMGTLWLSYLGGYERLEKFQFCVVAAMLVAVVISLLLIQPDWSGVLRGILIPQPLYYPTWIASETAFINRPVWVEVVTYVGILGGSGYDYLAYGSYLRDKKWGASDGVDGLLSMSVEDPRRPLYRQWLRVPLVDCSLSFLIVFVFTLVFVACGAVILGPKQQIPSGNNLLLLQASFVSDSIPSLKYLYFVGAFLTMFGTLYGTIEVAPAIAREILMATKRPVEKLRSWVLGWCGSVAFLILAYGAGAAILGTKHQIPGLVELLTPANLFTGVFACGIICGSCFIFESRLMPQDFRAPLLFRVVQAACGIGFLGLGIKAYIDHSGWRSLVLMGGTLGLGWGWAWIREKRLAITRKS